MPDGIVAETWEISDYKDTTGTVENGAYAGRKLRELVAEFPDELVGKGWRGPHFPLLEKFLDANTMLPVHLHADDATAKCKYCEPNGKTEAWHILWAAPGATILAGTHTHNRSDLFNAFKKQDYDAVIPRLPIKSGDTIYVPAGVLHSFGPDTVVFEVQQTSDLAVTVMPTDIYGKPHDVSVWEHNINETLDEMRDHPNPTPNQGLARKNGTNKITVCCAGPYFAMERWALTETHKEPAHEHRCLTLTGINGDVTIKYDGASETLPKGVSCIIPAGIGEFSVVPQNGSAELIACYVPNLDDDIRKHLKDAGHSAEAISSLGEL
jgi:mannose-6-phosphate isomerase